MLMDWSLANVRLDADLNMLTLEVAATPCPDTDDLHDLIAKDVEQLKTRSIKYLNAFAHTDPTTFQNP